MTMADMTAGSMPAPEVPGWVLELRDLVAQELTRSFDGFKLAPNGTNIMLGDKVVTPEMVNARLEAWLLEFAVANPSRAIDVVRYSDLLGIAPGGDRLKLLQLAWLLQEDGLTTENYPYK